MSWVSILLLISMDEDTRFEIESICIVTYAIINYDVTINGSDNPLLCPMKILYVGVPHTLIMSIENHSPIAGALLILLLFTRMSSANCFRYVLFFETVRR